MEPQKTKAKILMIEDDTFFLKVYEDQLTRQGYDFIAATNGIEGMHKILAEKPDLVLLDLMLPQENGFEWLEEVKKNEKIKDTVVVVLTNLGQQSDVDAAMALGAADYIVKTNVRMSDVLEKIKQRLSKR